MTAASDDLTRPLGMSAAPARRWPRLPLGRIAAAASAVALLGLGGALAWLGDPHGGEPHAVVAIVPRAVVPEVRPSNPQIREVGPESASRTASEVETASGVSVVRPDGQAAPGAVVIRVPEGPIRLNPAPDPRLVEKTRHGTLPRVGPDGARALSVYARPAAGALANGTAPIGRVAILVGGLGISAATTAEAMAKLPAPVTLAFAPYGTGLDGTVAKARDKGHEVMLQVPMEPFDYPDNDPGPHTLTVKGKAQENADKLAWVLGRVSGYTGLVNFMGARLTSDEAALTPILREVGARGLGFLDDGSSSRSLVTEVGPRTQVPAARADIVLDASPRPDAIDEALSRLEEKARTGSVAVGTASALPMTIDRIARWSRSLETRGILLVPVSSVLANPSRR